MPLQERIFNRSKLSASCRSHVLEQSNVLCGYATKRLEARISIHCKVGRSQAEHDTLCASASNDCESKVLYFYIQKRAYCSTTLPMPLQKDYCLKATLVVTMQQKPRKSTTLAVQILQEFCKSERCTVYLQVILHQDQNIVVYHYAKVISSSVHQMCKLLYDIYGEKTQFQL